MSKAKAFFLELRAPFLTASLIPVLVGTAVAFHQQGKMHWGLFVLVLLGFVFYHLGTNVLNDYWDFRNGTDNCNQEFVPPFTGGSRLIQQGLLTPREVFWEAMLFFLAGSVIALYLTSLFGIWMFAAWLFAFVSGFFYTAPPFKWVHSGWGEILVGLNFGPLLVMTAYYTQTQQLQLLPFLVSLPVACLVTAILYINEFPDFHADTKTGKRNLVVRLGREKARIGYSVLLLSAYLAVGAMLIFNLMPARLLVLFAASPLALIGVFQLWKYHSESARLAPACGLTIGLHLITGILLCCVFIF
jgi:1,4-dihydroxy-2-naphthoate octaprenyltransferase